MRRRTRATGALALLFALTTTACPSTAPRPVESPRAGGSLTIAIRDLGSLDPAKAAARGALSVVAQLFDPLTAIDPVTGAVVPAAAASWTSSKDGKRWRFKLRPATYTDGTKVLAADFKLAFDRIARKSTQADAAFQLQPVSGFRASHTTGRAKQLAGVRVTGARELLIVLDRPFSELPYFLAHPALAPIPKRYAKSLKGLDTSPVGNGPFKIVKAKLEREAVLERNTTYVGTPAYLDRLEFRVLRSIDEGWKAFLDHEVDVADVPPSAVESRREIVGEGGFKPFWATLSFGPNLRLPKYRKPEVRRALSLALDRDAIASTVYGNTKVAATGLLPRGVRGYVPDACGACVADRGRASQILDAAFGGDKPRIRIDHLKDDTSTRLARAVATDLRKVGVRASLKAYTNSQYLKLLQAGKQDFAQLGWLAVVPTPDGFLAEQLRTGAQNNTTGFKDPTFDKAVDRARRERDDAKRLARYRAAEARALTLMPIIPIVFFRNRTAVASHVRAFTLDGAGVFDATRVWIAA